VANAGKAIAAGTKSLTKDAWQAKKENENARGFLSGERLASNPILNLGERGKVENESGLPEMMHLGLKTAYAGIMQNGGSEPAQELLHQQQHSANALATEHINSALEQVSSRSTKSDHSGHAEEPEATVHPEEPVHSGEPATTAQTDEAITPVHSGEPGATVHPEEPVSESTHLENVLGEHRDAAERAVLDYQDEKIESVTNPEEPELHERPKGLDVEPVPAVNVAPRAKFKPKKAKTPSVDPDHASMNKLFGEKKQKTPSVGPEHESMESMFREHPGFEAARPTEEHNFQKALDPIADSGTRKGLGWFRKMKSAAGRASTSIRRGVASLKQRLGFGNGPVERDENVPRVGELPKKFDDGMNPSWHHPTRR
jgi:hypothetical protein